MRLPNLIKSVLEKTVDINPTDLNDMINKCHLWYDENVQETEKKEREKEPLTLKDKIFKHLDSWYVRIGLAFSFFVIVRWVQDFMNPGDDTPNDVNMPG